MTAFPWNNASEEFDRALQASEPSHVHIPRPSRTESGPAAEPSLEEYSVVHLALTCLDN
jgi:hypothetical protein